jgi:hypothetical protein
MSSIHLRARLLSTASDPFATGPPLSALRAKFGDSEFGYRIQALFGYTLRSLGARVDEINAQGHPDIRAQWRGQILLFQVKTLLHRFAEHRYTLSTEDLRGITPTTNSETGFLALLDCGSPAEWILVTQSRVRAHLERPIHPATLRADSDKRLSRLCTEEFNKLILSVDDRLGDLTFSLLCQRAMTPL